MRIDELPFELERALFRGDGTGVAVVLTPASPANGPTWAKVAAAGAGVPAGYLCLEPHAGAVQVFAVDGGASAEPLHRTDLDPRLTPLGEYFDHADPAQARTIDAARAQKTAADNAAIAAATFTVAARISGTDWSVEVGPTAFARTTLVLRGPGGGTRLLETAAARAALERSRTETVTVDAEETVPRARFDARPGTRRRTLQVTLHPMSDAAR